VKAIGPSHLKWMSGFPFDKSPGFSAVDYPSQASPIISVWSSCAGGWSSISIVSSSVQERRPRQLRLIEAHMLLLWNDRAAPLPSRNTTAATCSGGSSSLAKRSFGQMLTAFGNKRNLDLSLSSEARSSRCESTRT
jgi:hypothetical protein